MACGVCVCVVLFYVCVWLLRGVLEYHWSIDELCGHKPILYITHTSSSFFLRGIGIYGIGITGRLRTTRDTQHSPRGRGGGGKGG